MELYYGLLVKYGKEVADLHYNININHCVTITDEIIKEAMLFRKDNKERGLSYVDYLRCIIIKKNGIKFLTGDREFKNIENVEFIK